MSIYQQIMQVQDELKLTLDLAKEHGKRMAACEAKYYTVKDLRVRELKTEGMSATLIEMVIKGEPGVNDALQAWRDAEIEYKNAVEGVNVLKKQYDFLREQYSREWSQSGWSDR